MTRLRQTIARRLKEAQDTAALLTTFNDVEHVGGDGRARGYKDLFAKKHGIRLGFMSFFAKASVPGAEGHPGRQRPDRRRRDRLITITSTSRSRSRARAGWSCRWCATATRKSFAQIEQAIADYGAEGQGRHADHGRHAGRHLHHLQRRRVRQR